MSCAFIMTACKSGNEKNANHQHTLVAVSAVSATCTEDGIVAHYLCSDCGKTFSDENGNTPITDTIISALGHTGGNATCAQKAICERCSNEYGELSEHNYGDLIETTAPTCTKVGEKTAECSVCGDIKREEVVALGHIGEWETTAEPRCFASGEKQRICERCDLVEYETIPAYNSHDLQESTCVGGRQCSRCYYTEGTGKGHAYGDWETTVNPTCTVNGEKERVCLVCGDKQTGVVSAPGHNYKKWHTQKEATCTENGMKYSNCSNDYCSECKEEIIYKTGHSGEWTTTREPDCYYDGSKSNGEKTRTCTTCNTKETQTIYASHDFTYTVTKEANCKEAGTKSVCCKSCGYCYSETISISSSHSYSWTTTLEPTCTENGVEVGTCSVCGQEENRTITKLGHNMQGGTCDTYSQCSRCTYREYGEHKYGEYYVIEDPDCSRKGVKNAKCNICGDINEYYTQSLGHIYGEWEIRKAPTCTEYGRKRHICTVCGKVQDMEIDKLPHTESEWIDIETATCTADGTRKKICTVCETLLNEEVVSALGHDFLDATCLAPKTCKRCSLTEGGVALEHQLNNYKCTTCDFQYCNESGSEFFTYQLSDDGNSYLISKINVSSSLNKILVPSTYNDKPVIGIGSGECVISDSGSYYEFQISLSDSIEFIAENAFKSTKVEKVIIGANSKLKTIGDSAFYYCSELSSITIPEGVTSIGNSAFYSCSSLTSITIPEGVTSIGDSAFYHCRGLSSITIPEGVTSIGDSAFYYCSSLTSITIPEGVKSIGNYAFYNCTLLTSITIPEGVTSIGEYAFFKCSGLSSLIIPNGVTSIGNSAFKDCTALTNVTLPKSVTSIGNFVFNGCSSLIEMTIPFVGPSLDTTSGSAYQYLFGYIFGNSSYTGGTAVRQLYYDGNSVSAQNLYYIPSSLKKITILGGDIPYGAFSKCSMLTDITISNGVTSIGGYAFKECTSLTGITISESVTSIGEYAFHMCTELKGVHITNLDKWVSINFDGYYANPLCYAKNLYLNGELVVDAILTNVTKISAYAFNNCTSLTSIIIPESVTSIEMQAFGGCNRLYNVYYGGTQNQWNQISFGTSGNDYLRIATIHYNYKPE